MKKIFSLLFLIIIALGVVSCRNKVSISTDIKSINIYENETFELKDDLFTVSKSESTIVYTVLDEEIAEIKDNIIYPKTSGATKVRATIEKNKRLKIFFIIIVFLFCLHIF